MPKKMFLPLFSQLHIDSSRKKESSAREWAHLMSHRFEEAAYSSKCCPKTMKHQVVSTVSASERHFGTSLSDLFTDISRFASPPLWRMLPS